MRVLLISNSGRPFLEHARPHIADFLGGSLKCLAFVTAASLDDEVVYYQRAQAALAPLPPDGIGVPVVHLRWDAEPLATLARADAVFVGGGNTYALLKRLREGQLLEPIRARVQAGMPYIGSSAGANLAGPRILTTNDWNVVALDIFDALGLVPSTSTLTTSRPTRQWLREAKRATTASSSTTSCGTTSWSVSRKARSCAWRTTPSPSAGAVG